MYYLSFCAIFKDEHPWLREWIDYHHNRGVEHFIMFNNDIDPEESNEILRPYVENGIVTLRRQPGMGQLFKAYSQGLHWAKQHTRWLGVFDLDEFILPMQTGSIPEVLQNYEEFSGLTLNWRIFGSSHLERRPPNQINHFLWCAQKMHPLNRHVKSFCNPAKLSQIGKAHCFRYDQGHSVDTTGEVVNGPWNRRHPEDIMRINHYVVRSKEDFPIKDRKGRPEYMEHAPRDESYFKKHDINDMYDDNIARRFGHEIEHKFKML